MYIVFKWSDFVYAYQSELNLSPLFMYFFWQAWLDESGHKRELDSLVPTHASLSKWTLFDVEKKRWLMQQPCFQWCTISPCYCLFFHRMVITPGCTGLMDILFSPVWLIHSVLETMQSTLSKDASSRKATGPQSFFFDFVIRLTVCSLGWPYKNMINLKCIMSIQMQFFTCISALQALTIFWQACLRSSHFCNIAFECFPSRG